ncbi:MAG: bifunctional DNA primase/polymerase [Streptosporangiaceae bacterium]
MDVPVPHWPRRGPRGRHLQAAIEFADLGWPVCPGAYPLDEGPRACSCDRVGCPAPGAHPLSPAWAVQATTDKERLRRWWAVDPNASVVLSTGRVVDALDVPAEAGIVALARADRSETPIGPVAAYGGDRYLFFVAIRGAPGEEEEEWWPCHLDVTDPHTQPEPVTPELRWHSRGSYVLAPPSALVGQQVCWVRRPRDPALPDSLPLLEVLTDTVEELARSHPAPDPRGRAMRHSGM